MTLVLVILEDWLTLSRWGRSLSVIYLSIYLYNSPKTQNELLIADNTYAK